MPIFMDRHEGDDGSTPEEIAAAHLEDLRHQSKHACKALTYWFDGERKTTFCLFEAPSAGAVRELHAEAHGQIPNRIIEVDKSQVDAFLGRVSDPPASPIRDAAFRSLMFTDMADSTRLTRELGDDDALALARDYHRIVRDALLEHAGREVDRAGDGFLTSFDSVSRCVGCAISIQRELSRANEGRREETFVRVRIGLGAGEPVTDGGALFGSTVNLTSRICDRAEPGQILASRVVRELCIGKKFTFQPIGPVALKGFPEPVELDAVDWQA